MKQEQIQKRKQKRREPTTEELQADFLERRERETSERLKRLLGETAVVEQHIEEALE